MLRVARATAVLGASVIAVVASCFSKPDEPHLGDGDGDGGVNDGRTDGRTNPLIDAALDAPPPACTMDTFTSGTGCGALGVSYGPGGLVGRMSGQLSMTPASSAGGCHSTSAFSFTKGTSIKVAQIAHNNAITNTTTLTVSNGASTTQGMQVIFNDSGNSSVVFDVQCLGLTTMPTPIEVNYDAATQRYWKFETVLGALAMEVHAFHSADGTTWTDVGTDAGTSFGCRWSSFSTVVVDIGVGAGSASLPALFDDFNVKTCP